MNEKQKGCCGPEGCPCYPNCDRMMTENWSPRAEKAVQTGRLDMDNRELMQLAKQDEEDLARMKELYPARIREILAEVERACDTMEYEGSIMFDEMPEKQRILDMADGIRRKMEGQMEKWEQEQSRLQEEDIYVMNHEYGVSQRRPPQPPPGPSRPPMPPQPPRPSDWFGDLVQVLLQHEMYHRRCRHRSCRRW
ncbi:hypothetical protein [Jingyaoa shaoxingensis]|uniref:Uncharacterized protein n=1 Tax=Jingyaoa shaoxingensis TaxID=2763671 RepID=A0ABR7N9I8_9FIRM|nr:hypothetical protein [Jingyaoa shaoxingensis]MBC8573056.1 hypothetical protein [Jingyaoa shaoxingensis]